MRILLVEDDLSLGTAISDALTVSGHATDWVKTAKHALHALETENFDLIKKISFTSKLDNKDINYIFSNYLIML